VLRSPTFRRWLIREYRKETRGFVPAEALNGLIASLEADAEDAGPMRSVYLRVGGDLDGTVIYLDLGDPSRRAVEITADGWRIVDRPGVTFRRAKGIRPLPEPRTGGWNSDTLNLHNLVGRSKEFRHPPRDSQREPKKLFRCDAGITNVRFG
jgi:hypothetical protein